MLTTNGVCGCHRHPCADSPTRITRTIGNLSTIDLKSLSKNIAELKADISSRVNPTCIARMKRLKNRKMNGTPKMDLNKKRPADYTELAYREAISKLKYLLSEFYPPTGVSGTKLQTIRSTYRTGNPRISESGEDTDDQSIISGNLRRRNRKTILNTFPLLSKNIQPTKAYSNIALSKTDLSSLPPELTSFIERQEDYIEQLERESQYCRDELVNLLSKVREVVAENEALHNKNPTILSKCSLQDHNDCAQLDRTECCEQNVIDRNANKEEKKEKLLEAPSIIFESRISELEAQLTQTKLELRKAQENQMNLKRMSESCSSEGNADVKIELDKALRSKYETEIKLEELQKLLSAARDKETEATHRARRSMDDRQQIEFERNQDEIEIRRLKDELERQHEKLREASQEASKRITEERQQVERRYNQQIDQLSADVASHWEVANKSQLETEKQRREINELRRELSQKQTSMDNLKKELQNKISTLQSDLNQALSEKDAAEQEVLTGKLAAERGERQARQEQSRLQTEINSYKQRLERADADLVHCRRENLRLSEQIASLEKEINMSKITHPESSRSQVTPKLENEKELTSMIMDMETKNEGVIERDVTTVGQTASPSSKKRTVKVDLKVKVIPKKKSSKMSLSAQEEMAGLQSNIEHLSNKIHDTLVGHEEGNPMETKDSTSATFLYNRTMDSVDPSHVNRVSVSENNPPDSQTISQVYKITSPNQKVADEESSERIYSNISKGNDQSQNLYDLPSSQIQTVEGNSVPHMTESMEMYQQQRDTHNNEEEYTVSDQNMDYMAEQEYNQYGDYGQYQEEQYMNGEQYNVVTEQTEDNQTVSGATAPDTLH